MWDACDYIVAKVITILMLSILSLSIAGSYAIIKQTNNPELYRKYEINGSTPTLAIKEI